MKLTAIIVLVACLQVSAKGFGQLISISERNVPLEKVFSEIKKQSGYTFAYTESILTNAKKITIDISNGTLEQVLNLCFKEQPFTYAIIEKTIVIKPKEESSSVLEEFFPLPPIDVHGKVVNEKGEPLASVTVTVKGTRNATATDANGEFVLTGVDEKAFLVFTSTNTETLEVKVKGKTDVAITLKIKVSSLDQVQVIAYGSTTQRFSTGDISTVKAEDIEKQPVSNPLLALEGRVPGLFITQSTGLPGAGVVVQIRGQNSIANGNDPFYVIDGVPYASELLPNFGGILGASGVNNQSNGNPLSYINPGDIESISVLKDADATAIYGSRAANGAILITTKKGKAGQSIVDLNVQNGWGQVTRKLNLLSTSQYLEMRHEAINNDGLTTQPTDYDINGFWDTTRYTDWQKVLIGGTAQYTNLSGTLSGGSANTQYLVGCTFHRETTVFPGEFDDQKGSLHFNINSNSPNQKFLFQLTGNYLVDNNKLPAADLTNPAIYFPPDAPPLYNKDGSLNWMPTPSGSSTWTNPLANYTLNPYNNKTSNLVGNMVLSYHVFTGLEIKSSFGYTNLQSNEVLPHPLISVSPEDRPISTRFTHFINNNINSWIIEPQAIYTKVIGRGKLEALVGTTIEQNNSNGSTIIGWNYNSDQSMEDIQSSATILHGGSVVSVYKYNAIFSRLNYNWKETFLVNLTARRDGGSRFGPANQFHNFDAVGIGWIFSQQEFVKQRLPFLSFGKLRASYGTTGNDQIGDYNFLSLYSPNTGQIPYQGGTGLSPNGLPNPYLQWEETKKAEFGLDLGLFNSRILINSSYFQNRSSNQLLSNTLPFITGTNSININFPATVENYGLEFSLNTSNIKTKDFTWSTNFNLSIPKNKLIAFPNLSNSTFANSLIVGQPLTLIRVFHLLGVDPATGMYKFASKTDPFNPVYADDATVLINTSPAYYGGFQNSFNYKGFELDILFQFVKQKGLNYSFGSYPGSAFTNQPASILNRWQKPADIKPIERYNSDYSLANQYGDAAYASDAAWSDASYIRLKNLSVSWQLPAIWRTKAHLHNARVYMQGQNLLTLTHYSGLDPETRSTLTLPPLRVLTFGIQVTF